MLEQLQAQIDEDMAYREIVEYELAQNMSIAFVNCFDDAKLKMAAMSIASARWDAVRRDLDKGRITKDEVARLYQEAVAYKVVTVDMASQQLGLCEPKEV